MHNEFSGAFEKSPMNPEQLVMKSPKKRASDSNRLTEADHEVLGAQLTGIICHKALTYHPLKAKDYTVRSMTMPQYPSSVVMSTQILTNARNKWICDLNKTHGPSLPSH